MKKWELASYLIEAKKVIDSLWYIILNEKQIDNLDLRSKVKDLRRKFYLNCGYVLENSGLNKKDICARNDTIKGIFYERDKNEAHKDEDYKGKNRNEIVVDEDKYFDRYGKIGADERRLTEYIKNIYYVLMTRGIKGTYIYVCDDELRKYFNQYID